MYWKVLSVSSFSMLIYADQSSISTWDSKVLSNIILPRSILSRELSIKSCSRKDSDNQQYGKQSLSLIRKCPENSMEVEIIISLGILLLAMTFARRQHLHSGRYGRVLLHQLHSSPVPALTSQPSCMCYWLFLSSPWLLYYLLYSDALVGEMPPKEMDGVVMYLLWIDSLYLRAPFLSRKVIQACVSNTAWECKQCVNAS